LNFLETRFAPHSQTVCKSNKNPEAKTKHKSIVLNKIKQEFSFTHLLFLYVGVGIDSSYRTQLQKICFNSFLELIFQNMLGVSLVIDKSLEYRFCFLDLTKN
jgi:hypothetical protein